jgi:hypothetical protein
MKSNAERQREFRQRQRAARNVTPTNQEPNELAVLPVQSVAGSPARAKRSRVDNLPEPRKPGNPRVPLCPPAPRDAYKLAKMLLIQGHSFGEVEDRTGARYIELSEAADAYGDRAVWNVVQAEQKRAMSLRIASAAAEAGIRGMRRKVVEKTVLGVGTERTVTERTVTEEHGTDAALLRVAGEYTDPERHGKLASAAAARGAAGPVQIAVTFVHAGGGGGGGDRTAEPDGFAVDMRAVEVEQVEDAPAPFAFVPAPAEPVPEPDAEPIPARAALPRERFNPFAPRESAQGDEIHADAEGRP